MNHDLMTARKAGLIACHSCHLLSQNTKRSEDRRCSRCGASLHERKPNSIARTWALIIASFIFYLPANVLPITTVISLGKAQSDTIMSGVIYFIASGMWPIALVIFVASILVPILKLIILIFLLITVQRKSTWRAKDLDVHYKAVRTGDGLEISGFIEFGSNLAKFPLINYFRIHLHFIDTI